jgi:DNA-binding MarR family transcriptional regulator
MTATTADGDKRHALVERSAFLLARLGRVAARRLNDELAATGLKPPETAVLIVLRDLGPLSQQALGRHLHVDPSNLVASLNSLESEGLLERRRDPDDRRRHIVEITKQGRKRLPACDDSVDSLEVQLFGGLTEQDRDQLNRILTRILLTAQIEEPSPEKNPSLD